MASARLHGGVMYNCSISMDDEHAPMPNSEVPKQSAVSGIWDEVWKEDDHSSVRLLFKHRMFVEGFPVYRRNIPVDAKDILEVGTGTGRYGVAIARDLPKSRVVATDILPSALVIARRLADEFGVKNVEFREEDALRLSFPDNSFDVVFSDAVLQHLPDPALALREMYRVVRPDGRVIASSVNGWNIPHRLHRTLLRLAGKEYRYGYEKNFTPRELKHLFLREGFDVVGEDGYYFAYGVYRWKVYHPIWKYVGGALNRVTKFLDALSFRAVSRYFGFEIFCVGRKPRGEGRNG